MLTFITLSRNTGSSLPKVSYIKATEIWFIGCTVFIFGSLVEFAFVNTIWRRRWTARLWNILLTKSTYPANKETRFYCRKDIELKKVTSKHVLRATLTPQLNRKSLSSSTQSLPSIQTIHENNLRMVSEYINSVQYTVQQYRKIPQSKSRAYILITIPIDYRKFGYWRRLFVIPIRV